MLPRADAFDRLRFVFQAGGSMQSALAEPNRSAT
jgi:hypothetical protein